MNGATNVLAQVAMAASFIAAAGRTAGLTGSVKLNWRDVEGEFQETLLPFDDIASGKAPWPTSGSNWSIDGRCYQAPPWGDPGDATAIAAACVFATVEHVISLGLERGDDDPSEPEPLWKAVAERRPEELAAKARPMDDHLAVLGRLKILSWWQDIFQATGRGGTRHVVTRRRTYSFAAILAAAVDLSSEGGALLYGELEQAFGSICTPPGIGASWISAEVPIDATARWSGWAGARGEDWLRGLQMSASTIAALAVDQRRSGNSHQLFGAYADKRLPRKPCRIDYLQPGRLPRAMVVVLAGAGGIGKSTLAHELLIAAGTPKMDGQEPLQWLGAPVVQAERPGACIMLASEDIAAAVTERTARLDPNGRATAATVIGGGRDELREILNGFADVRRGPGEDDDERLPRLLILDSAQSFIVGDGNRGEDISRFFDPLKEFAERTGCTVLVLGHLNKDEHPKYLAAFHKAIRGSNVLIERPRVVLGMYGKPGDVHVGIVKHNMPASHAILPEARFIGDPETYRHRPAPDDPGPARAVGGRKGTTASATTGAIEAASAAKLVPAAVKTKPAGAALDIEQRIVNAVERITGEGGIVCRTGRRGLYKLRLPELAGQLEAHVTRAAWALVEVGRLTIGDGGALAVPAG